MNRLGILLLPGVAIVVWLAAIDQSGAEIPNQSKEKLAAAASHVIMGTIVRTYEQKEEQGDYEHTYAVAEVAVERVEKGTDIKANDRVFVRYWRKKWLRAGNPPPGHFGHRNVPKPSDSAEIYVKGDRKTGFDVLSPNGFFEMTKLEGQRP